MKLTHIFKLPEKASQQDAKILIDGIEKSGVAVANSKIEVTKIPTDYSDLVIQHGELVRLLIIGGKK